MHQRSVLLQPMLCAFCQRRRPVLLGLTGIGALLAYSPPTHVEMHHPFRMEAFVALPTTRSCGSPRLLILTRQAGLTLPLDSFKPTLISTVERVGRRAVGIHRSRGFHITTPRLQLGSLASAPASSVVVRTLYRSGPVDVFTPTAFPRSCRMVHLLFQRHLLVEGVLWVIRVTLL